MLTSPLVLFPLSIYLVGDTTVDYNVVEKASFSVCVALASPLFVALASLRWMGTALAKNAQVGDIVQNIFESPPW